MDGFLKKNLDLVKDLNKKDWDNVFLVDGTEGCLVGSTIIQVNRNKLGRRYSLKWIYNQFNNNPDKLKVRGLWKPWDLSKPSFIRSFNGAEIRLNKLIGAYYRGKKKTYLLELENNKSIKATADHRFLTREGWKELQYLTKDDEIMYDKLHASSKKRKRIKLYDIQLAVDYHPYKSKGKRVEVHRLIYEAYLNNLHFTEYLDILLNEPEQAKTLKYINPKKYNIHHKDGCHYNNAIENLQLLKIEDHLKHHAKTSYANFNQGVPLFSKIKRISYNGIEDTYDLECEAPYHNFVANGIVVHNSGKSSIAMQIAYYLDPTFNLDRVCFTAFEFKKKVLDAKQRQAIVFDEAFTGLSSRGTMGIINRMLVRMMAEIRQKNLFFLIVAPTFFDIDKYIALWRSRALIHVYTKKMKRGYFMGYNQDRKKQLYLRGKKDYNYNKPSPNFIGRFTKYLPINEQKYRQKKYEAIKKKDINTPKGKWKDERNSLIQVLTEQGWTRQQIADAINKYSDSHMTYRGISYVLQGIDNDEV